MTNGAFEKKNPPPPAKAASPATASSPPALKTDGKANVPLYEIGTTGVRISGGVVYESRLKNFKGSQRAIVIREMSETDATIAGLLSNFTMLGRNVEYSIETEGKSANDKKAVELIESCLEDMEDSFEDYMTSFFSVLPFGYTFHELNWKMRQGEDPPETTIKDQDGKPIQIKPPPSQYDDGMIGWWGWPIRKQDTITRWKLSNNGRIEGAYQRVENTGYGKAGERFIPIDKAIHITTNSADGNPEGRSILEAVYRSWFFKRNFEELVGIGVKRDLVGYPVMSFPSSQGIWLEQNSTKMAQAQTLISNLFRDELEGLVKPDDVTVELLASGGPPRFDIKALMEWLRLEIAIGTLTEFALVGHEGSGSLALKREATRVFMLALDGVLKSIAGAINDQAIRPLLKLNQMKLTAEPKLKFGTVDVPTVEAIIDALSKLATAGAEIFPDPELQKHIYNKLQVPIPTDEDLMRTPVEDQVAQGQLDLQEKQQKIDAEVAKEAAKHPAPVVAPPGKPAQPGQAGPPAKAEPQKKAATEEEEQKPQLFFDQSQPRVPAGSPEGGQWSGQGGGSSESKSGQISLETTPGHSTRVLEGIHSAPYAERAAFMREVESVLHEEELLGELGLHGSEFEVVGVWNGEQNPGIQIEIGKTNDSPEVLKTKVEAFAAAMGKALYQEGVGYHIPRYNGDPAQHNMAEVNIGRVLDRSEIGRIYTELKREMPGLDDEVALIGSRNGVRVLNWAGATANETFHQKLLAATERANIGNFFVDTFTVESDVVTNNWKVNSHGEGYDSKIAAGGSRFQGRANRVYDRARTVYEKYGAKWAAKAKAARERKEVTPAPRYDDVYFEGMKYLNDVAAGRIDDALEFYSPDQPRDDQGRWTDTGSGGTSAPADETAAPTWALSPGGEGAIAERNPTDTTAKAKREALESTDKSIRSKLTQIGAENRELSPLELKRVTELVTSHLESNPEIEAALKAMNVDEKRVTLNAEDRYTLSLHESSHLSVYLLRWGPGQQAEWHDHGDGDQGAKVSIRVLDGPVENDFLNAKGQVVKQELEEGKTYWLPAPYLHRMGDWAEGRGAGWSVHSYSGPNGGLDKMTWYKFDEGNNIVLGENGKPIPVGTWEREKPKEQPPSVGSEFPSGELEGVYEIDDEGNLKPVVGTVIGEAKKFYSRDQPRVPAGSPEGGQWADAEGGSGDEPPLPGMPAAYRTPKPLITPYNHWLPKRGYDDDSFTTVADTIRDESVERGVVWDKDGRMLASFTNEKSGSVQVPEELIPSLAGATLMHNHPHNDYDEASSFSDGDLVSGIANDVDRIIVASRVRGEAVTFTARFGDPDAIKNKVPPEAISAYMGNSINLVWPVVNAAAGAGVFGELSTEDQLPWTVATHLVNRQLSQDLGYYYRAEWRGRIGAKEVGSLDDAVTRVTKWVMTGSIGGGSPFRRDTGQLVLPEPREPAPKEPVPFSEDDDKAKKAKRRWLEEGPRKEDGEKFTWDSPEKKPLEPPKFFYDESEHPRHPAGSPDSMGGKWAPKDGGLGAGGGGAAAPGELGPDFILHQQAMPPTSGSIFNPDPLGDANGDGVADASRVGVPAMEVPDKIPRLPDLNAHERDAEENFAKQYEDDPDGMAKAYRDQMLASSAASMERANAIADPTERAQAIANARLEAVTFNTDDAKLLSQDYNPEGVPKEVQLAARASVNVAVHNTANAISKRAFLQYLDEIGPTLAPEDRVIVVTNGGVASGKSFSLTAAPEVKALADSATAIWDAAGEANATENPWVLEEARARGFQTVFTYTDADPLDIWANPQRGVIERAGKKGRMVTARLFAESYVYGAKNFAEFAKTHAGESDVRFAFFDNSRKTPEGTPAKPVKVDAMPKHALNRKVRDILPHADQMLASLFSKGKVSNSIFSGGANHKRIWKRAPRRMREPLEFGGAGSGNFGHAGRPGEVGGSAPGEGGAVSGKSVETIVSGIKNAGLRMYAPDLKKDIGNDVTGTIQHYILDKKTGDWWLKGTLDTGWTGNAGKKRIEQAAEEIRRRVIETGGQSEDVRVGVFQHGGGAGTSANIHNTATIAIRVQSLTQAEIDEKLEDIEGRLAGKRPRSIPLSPKTAEGLRSK